MLGIVRHRDAPGKRRAADRLIAQPRTDERDDLVAPRLRTNEVRIRIKRQQFVLKRRQLEKVIFFRHRLGNAAASGAGIARLRAIDIKLVRDTVLARVSSLINKTTVAKTAEELLHSLRVPLFGGPDEIIVRDAHPLPQLAELRRNFVRILLRSLARSQRSPLNLLPVLISACEKKCFRAQQALPPRNRVARNRRISVPDVRTRVHVINRRRNIKLSAHKVLMPYPVNPCVLCVKAFDLPDKPVQLPVSRFSAAHDAPPRSAGNLRIPERNS